MQALFLQATNVFGSDILDFERYECVDAQVSKTCILESIDVTGGCSGLGMRAGACLCFCASGLLD